MLLAYFMFQPVYASDKGPDNNKRTATRFEIGACMGISAECMHPALKFGFVRNSIAIGVSLSPMLYTSTLSVRFYPTKATRFRPYSYIGVMGYFGYGGDIAPGLGLGVDVKMGPLTLQPSIGYVRSEFGGSLGLLIRI